MKPEYVQAVIAARARKGLRTDPRELDELTDAYAAEQASIVRENDLRLRELQVAEKEELFGDIEEREAELAQKTDVLQKMFNRNRIYVKELLEVADNVTGAPEKRLRNLAEEMEQDWRVANR